MKIASTLILFATCGTIAFGQNAPAPETPNSQSGLDLNAIDKSADPCTNFYQYACGTWIKNNKIPEDESVWGTFNELNERNQAILHKIADDAAAHTSRSALDQKVGDYYGSCMAEDQIEQLGTKPIQPGLQRIAALSSKADLAERGRASSQAKRRCLLQLRVQS